MRICRFITILIEAHESTKEVKSCIDGRSQRGHGSLGKGGLRASIDFSASGDVLHRRADIFARDYWTFWDIYPFEITTNLIY